MTGVVTSHEVLELPQDYEDLLRELSLASVDYLLIGGWAVAVHGHGRTTDDIDIFVRANAENAARVFRALVNFGAPVHAHGISEGLFAQEEYGYRMGRKPLLIEILTKIDGVSYDEAERDAVSVQVAGFEVRVIGRRALIKNKEASGRPKDIADVEALTASAEEPLGSG